MEEKVLKCKKCGHKVMVNPKDPFLGTFKGSYHMGYQNYGGTLGIQKCFDDACMAKGCKCKKAEV